MSAAVRDSEDLEALFERVAAEAAKPVAAPARKKAASKSPATMDVTAAGGTQEDPYVVFQRIGSLTRSLHDALRELGYDKTIQGAMASLPDARDRLDYVAELTGKAAERALAAAETGKAIQDGIAAEACALGAHWEKVFAAELSVEQFKSLAGETHAFLAGLPGRAGDAGAQFTDIMLAQDFHDLTGQMIQRIVKLARNLEAQLVNLLVETTPPERRTVVEEGWLNGPAVKAGVRVDVVTSQAQVDDLLESLGF